MRSNSTLLLSSTQADPIDVYVGARIRDARKAKNMSQVDLGHACGITFQQIQKYERAQNRVSASRLVQIANALGKSVIFFFGPHGGVK